MVQLRNSLCRSDKRANEFCELVRLVDKSDEPVSLPSEVDGVSTPAAGRIGVTEEVEESARV